MKFQTYTLEELHDVITRSWNWDTAFLPEARDLFDPENPAKYQCLVTALVIQGLMGGDIMAGSVGSYPHWWNRTKHLEIDMTRSQFTEQELSELSPNPAIISREAAFWHLRDRNRYIIFRNRVLHSLNLQGREF